MTARERRVVPHVALERAVSETEYRSGARLFTAEQAAEEVERCLNCDIQTVFTEKLCIECDACIDICPVDCLTITHDGDEADLRTRLTAPAPNIEQALYVSAALPQTGRVMVKDEDLCVHCGLCAERCPTAAWDMQQFGLLHPHAEDEAGIARMRPTVDLAPEPVPSAKKNRPANRQVPFTSLQR